MIASNWKTLFSIFIAMSAIRTQYIPFPTATKLNTQPPYLNPSINDALFTDANTFTLATPNSLANPTPPQLPNAIKFLGNSVYYDANRKIYINISTGDYYDPTTGLIYRRVGGDRNGFINGRLGPASVLSHAGPHAQSDEVDLPRDVRRRYYSAGEAESEEGDCKDCERSGQCYRCRRVVAPKRDCGACYGGRAYGECDSCYKSQLVGNLPYAKMGEMIVVLLNRYRKSFDLKDVLYNRHLYEIAMIQNLYMENRGYLNNDNFEANISTFKSGAMTTGYIQEARLNDIDGAEKFMSMWKKSADHNSNLLLPNIDQCGAAVHFDEKNGKFIGTLICVKL